MRIRIPKSKLFYKGNLEKDREKSQKQTGNEWLIGNFCKFDKDDARKTSVIEIKYWIKKVNDPAHKSKVQVSATEITIILKGEIQGSINGENIVMKKNDYVLIKPGITNNLVEKVIKKTEGITIKVPSDPSDKMS